MEEAAAATVAAIKVVKEDAVDMVEKAVMEVAEEAVIVEEEEDIESYHHYRNQK